MSHACAKHTKPNGLIPRRATHVSVALGEVLGRGGQGGLGVGGDAIRRHGDHLALLGRKLGKDVALEAPEHEGLLQKELQLGEVRRARVIPAPRQLQGERAGGEREEGERKVVRFTQQMEGKKDADRAMK